MLTTPGDRVAYTKRLLSKSINSCLTPQEQFLGDLIKDYDKAVSLALDIPESEDKIANLEAHYESLASDTKGLVDENVDLVAKVKRLKALNTTLEIRRVDLENEVKRLKLAYANDISLPPDLEEDKRSICLIADELVSEDRRKDYGHPRENFKDIAAMWNVIFKDEDLEKGITPAQVGLCMIAVKLARHSHKSKRDNLIDICGYAKTVDLVEND